MAVVPNDRLQKIAFYEAHLPAWTANAVAIGLTVPQVAALEILLVTARGNATVADTTREASKTATKDFYTAVSELSAVGASYMSAIRAKAEVTGNLNVYSLAQIPPPSAGTPVGPPGTPTDFKVELLQDGSIVLKWKCANPEGAAGTLYEVRRKVGTGAFVFIGASGTKNFIDDTVPSGVPGIVYQVTGVRSTQRGNPSQLNVNFGVGGDGFSFAEANHEAKLAA